MLMIMAEDVKGLFPKKIRFEFIVALNKEFILKVLRFIQYPAAAMASIIPFLILPDFLAARTSIYFMEFLTVWLFIKIIPNFFNLLVTKKSSNRFLHRPSLFLPTIIFLTLFQYLIITHMISLNNIKHKVIERNKYIQQFSGNSIDLVIDKIDTKLPFSFQFYTDISNDSNNWINMSIANYYKIKSIRSR